MQCQRETEAEDWDRCLRVLAGHFCGKIKEFHKFVVPMECPFCTVPDTEPQENDIEIIDGAVEDDNDDADDDDGDADNEESESDEYVVVEEDSNSSSSGDSDSNSEDYAVESDLEGA